MNKNKRIICHYCQHFFITWETDYPYGCRAMNFKGKQIPSAVVLKSSGKNCMLYEAKEKKVSDQS